MIRCVMPKSSMKVDSSNIQDVSYDQNSGTMVVTFNNGSTYQYRDVPIGVYQRLIDAPSKGSYFAEYIRHSFQGSRLR